jgi:RND family efflux transporter MFP subunit
MRWRIGAPWAALVLAACSTEAPAPAEEPPVAVRVAAATAAAALDRFVAVGTVRLRREGALGFSSPGRVAAILVDEGDRVKAGQILATLDLVTVNADLAAASAERTRAAAELKRVRELFAKGWLTQARVDAAEAAYRAAAASTDAAAYAARTAQIRAPADGIILSRDAEAGQVVPAGAAVVSFGDDSKGFVLRAPLTDRQVAGLATGGSAEVRIAALGDTSMTGRIVEIAGRADAATGTFDVEVALPSDPRLRSGQIGEAVFARAIESRGTAVVVPSKAVFAARAGEAFVYVVDASAGRVRARKVVPGETGDDGTIILAGLAAGERVATTNLPKLRDGTPIKPTAAPAR